jgi:hypothetical protein
MNHPIFKGDANEKYSGRRYASPVRSRGKKVSGARGTEIRLFYLECAGYPEFAPVKVVQDNGIPRE